MALQNIVPSYLYTNYQDDDNLQAFVVAYNTLAQQYLNTFNALQLPVYPNKSGSLLDWVGQGIYGFARPVVATGVVQALGAINSTRIDYPLPINGYATTGTATYQLATDDVYIRALCWNFYKADGNVFCVTWLKRRIGRFIFGPGQPANTNKFQNWNFDVGLLTKISVSFASSYVVNITIPASNSLSVTFKALVLSGALQLPFQFSFNITIA